MGSKKQRRQPTQPRPTALPYSSSSNNDFRALYPRISRAQQARTSATLLVAELEAQLEAIRAELESAKRNMSDADKECVEAETTMAMLRPRLCFRGDLPDCVALSILGSQLSHRAGGLAAMVCREFRATVGKARELKLFKSEVLAISAGGTHTVACMTSGVWSFGAGDLGQLGHGVDEEEDKPRVVQALEGKAVAGVSAGYNHTVVWTKAGEVHTFGNGGNGKLGHGGTEYGNVPRVVEALAGQRVGGASAGRDFTVVWTEAGEVYTFGNGDLGQLGHGVDEDEDVPRLVDALKGKAVAGVSAGGGQSGHTVVWTEAGEVFTFGYGDHGRLGHGGTEYENAPRVVEALAGQSVAGASAGYDHTVVWTEAGEVYTFGYGDSGELGHGGEGHGNVPRVVEALAGQSVVGASAGGDHTVVWTEAGEVYTFGDGGRGQLGHGGEGQENVPRLVQALAGQSVVGASACGDHTVVWTEAGEVHTFGSGECGELGHGWEEDENVPRVVIFPNLHTSPK